MKILTVIGNGFDKAHELPTNFDEFINYNYSALGKKYDVFKNDRNSWNEIEHTYADLLLEAMNERNYFDVLEEVDQIIQNYGLNEYGEVDYYNYSSDAFNETYEKIISYINLLKKI